MPLADSASKIYHTVFWSRIVDAGDDIEAVLEAVREAWHEFASPSPGGVRRWPVRGGFNGYQA